MTSCNFTRLVSLEFLLQTGCSIRMLRWSTRRVHMCTSLTPRPMTMVLGLGMRLRVRMHSTFENGVIRNGQQPCSAVNSFIDQGEFGAIKGRTAPHCDKHQFCNKMTVSI